MAKRSKHLSATYKSETNQLVRPALNFIKGSGWLTVLRTRRLPATCFTNSCATTSLLFRKLTKSRKHDWTFLTHSPDSTLDFHATLTRRGAGLFPSWMEWAHWLLLLAACMCCVRDIEHGRFGRWKRTGSSHIHLRSKLATFCAEKGKKLMPSRRLERLPRSLTMDCAGKRCHEALRLLR